MTIMKKNICGIVGVVFAVLFAAQASATSIGLNAAGSDPFATIQGPAITPDSSLLKVFQGHHSPITLDISSETNRGLPSLVTQAMTPSMPSAVMPNNVLLVPEPSLLMLLGFGLLLAGVSRRKR